MNSICIYCGSSSGAQPIYLEQARLLGTTLAQAHITLVYGGASVGLMGAVADAALAAGGRVVGVMPTSLIEKEIDHKGLTELHIVGDMHTRKAKMAELSDGFIAMPGGAGTLEEFFEMWTWSQLGYHLKPCGLLNVAGYFDPLMTFMRQAVSEKFMKAEHVDMILVEPAPAALLARLQSYKPVFVPKWVDRVASEA